MGITQVYCLLGEDKKLKLDLSNFHVLKYNFKLYVSLISFLSSTFQVHNNYVHGGAMVHGHTTS